MLRRIELGLRPQVTDTVGRNVQAKILESLGLTVDSVQLVKVFTVDGLSDEQLNTVLKEGALHDPIVQEASLEPIKGSADFFLEVGFRPGVTDNEGRTASETIAIVLGIKERRSVAVYVSNQYRICGNVSRADVEHIGRDLLANELIQRFSIKSREEWEAAPGFTPAAAQVLGKANSEVQIIELSTMSDDELMAYSRAHTLALGLTEMCMIRDHFSNAEVAKERAAYNLPANPTDAELEALAQTWSEHCKHKIFSANVDYKNNENGTACKINSLYKTFIQGSTKQLRARMGKKDFCHSVFKDNAGVIDFNETHDVCIKVETHNSPSALDPYGGALTGIVGVNRDPMGTGMGANMVCNTDVFCFASPFYEGEMPPRLLHPRRVLEGVREGVEHGGNKSGVPTVNGSIVFHERYLGKPLVYCGTVGMIPKKINGKPGYEKSALVGDHIIMAGGRIGADGIHGATFSSEELHEGSPATAVQIGDPITQRKMYDFIMRARDKGLYNAITDNGAGGLSSSVGEMAQDTNGCRVDISRAPLKYDGLRPWEILLSEAQERMTLAVPPASLAEFLQLAKEMDVEVTDLGEFTDTGMFHVCYGDKPVTFVDMEFLHDGVPQLQLDAVWERPEHVEQKISVCDGEQGALLKTMLGRLNICSKEYVVRQYDHEVKGGSVIKPMVGVLRDGPSDAGVMRPILSDEAGIVLSHGICPKFSDLDAYWMMANAVDEAVRNAVAVGGDIRHMAGVDNFCWCDPVQSEKTPDGRYKMAQLVRANQALAHYCLAYGVPCISGKDSMKNDYSGGGVKISIPPTVLFSIMGVIKNVNHTCTSDFKNAGDAIYLLGHSYCELGGSELADELKLAGGYVPQVDAVSARNRYLALHDAIGAGLVNAAHDLSDGGLAVAFAEMALAGRIGASLNLDAVSAVAGMNASELLYTESASRLLVTVPEQHTAQFEELFKNAGVCARVGSVVDSGAMRVRSGDSLLINENIEELAQAFKATLNF